MEGEGLRVQGEVVLRVGILHGVADAGVASHLASLLGESGVEIVEPGGGGPADGLVVLMSGAAFLEQGWLPDSGAARLSRVIPVRIGELDERRVPERLRALNWIDWNPERPSATLGFIVAGLLADPSRYRISRQLAHEAAAWEEAGRPDDRLIGDRRRAQRMREILDQLAGDPFAAPDEATVRFVAASDRATRKARRRKFGWRVVAGVAVLVAISVATEVIPSLRAISRNSRAAIVTAGSEAILEQSPEWSAANAAALMLEGTAQQRQLGRATLLKAMVRPWAISDTAAVDSAFAAAPYDRGARAAVLALTREATGLAFFNVRRGETLGAIEFDRRFEFIDASSENHIAAVAGQGGATAIEINTWATRELTRAGEYAGVRVLRKQIALWTEGGRLELRDIYGDGVRTVGRYRAVLDVVPGPGGAGAALVAEGPRRYAIVGLADGAVLVRGRVASDAEVGALDPDGRRAAIDGADGQFWVLGASGVRPTGIAVPVALNDLEWASRERLVIASDPEHAAVVFIPRAQHLGTVCGQSPSLAGVRVEPGGETVACGGDGRSFWRLPPPPVETRATPPQAPPGRIRSPYATVEIRGRRQRIASRGALGSGVTSWSEPFDSAISAAAFSPASHQVAFGSRRGSVAILGLTRSGSRILSGWTAPDSSPVVALRWNERLEADTASGQTWTIPRCEGCETDRGLIEAAWSRFSGCFTARQMAWITDDSRARLGLRECAPTFHIGED